MVISMTCVIPFKIVKRRLTLKSFLVFDLTSTMSKATTIKEAIKRFEETQNIVATEAEKVLIQTVSYVLNFASTRSSYGVKFHRLRRWMRRSLLSRIAREIEGHFTSDRMLRYLSLSSNNIDKINALAGLEKLKTLSLGRNLIKKIENLDTVANTLEELWLSYNQLDKLVKYYKNLTLLWFDLSLELRS